MLCAKKAGTATITVRAKDNPNYVYQTCSVRVLGACSAINSNSIYLLKKGTGNDFLGVLLNKTTANSSVRAYAFNSQSEQQWRITYLNNGYYTISPMNSTGMALGINSSGDTVILDDCGLTSTQWQIYVTNGNAHIVNRRTEIDLFERTDWKLYLSPDSQDKSILDIEDLAIVTALKRDYIVYRAEHIQTSISFELYDQIDYESPQCIALIRAVDTIRRQEKYKNKYAFRDSDGYCVSFYENLRQYNPNVEITKLTINSGPPKDYSLIVNYALAVGSLAPPPYNIIVGLVGIGLFPPETPVDIVSSALSFIPGRFGAIVSVANAIDNGANIQNNPTVDPSDIVVQIFIWKSPGVTPYSETTFGRDGFFIRDEHFLNALSSETGPAAPEKSDLEINGVKYNF